MNAKKYCKCGNERMPHANPKNEYYRYCRDCAYKRNPSTVLYEPETKKLPHQCQSVTCHNIRLPKNDYCGRCLNMFRDEAQYGDFGDLY